MSGKWKVEELREGQMVETTFWANPVEDSEFRFRATHLDGRRAPKVVLCDDPRVKPGAPCRVKIKVIHKKDVPDRGSIEVDYVETMPLELKGIYLDPVVSKKVQVCLESGLNILLDGPQGSGKTVMTREIARALGMEFVFFNCGAVVEATDFFATIQVRASQSGSPVTDFVKTDVLLAL
ncbi:MAG: AAA family ATPase, partial [Myxococcota bacterium]